jgi:hypothetical protein
MTSKKNYVRKNIDAYITNESLSFSISEKNVSHVADYGV